MPRKTDSKMQSDLYDSRRLGARPFRIKEDAQCDLISLLPEKMQLEPYEQ